MMKQIWKPGIHERKRNHDISWVPGFQIPLPAFLSRSAIRNPQTPIRLGPAVGNLNGLS
jgi:hypothetical protein